jgi:hypothetical protein
LNRTQSLVVLCLLVSCSFSFAAQNQSPSSIRAIENNLPIVFEPAPDQGDGAVALVGHVAGITVGFRPAAVVVGFQGKKSGQFQIQFDGARSVVPSGSEPQKSQTNYLLGSDPTQWRTHVPNYAKVAYAGLYPAIDAVFYGNGRQMEHDFIVSPGGDYRKIHMHLSDGARASLGKDGALSITLEDGSLQMQRPVIYQKVDGQRQQRDGSFRLLPGGDIGFTVEGYDPRYTLVIDPVLSFSTYISPLASAGNLIATDASGNNYVSGIASLGFPVTPSAFAGCADCTSDSVVTFISKLSSDGTTLLYSTVLGGNSFAQPTGIAVDANGNAVVSGWTGATDFPTKSGQPIATPNGNDVGFLVSLSADGSSLNYGTLLGSSPSSGLNAFTYGTAVALDSSGNAYVTGDTGNGFPTTPGALNQGGGGDFGNQFNVFLAKVSPTGGLVYSAVLGAADPQNGGGGPIGASAITIDAEGDAYIAGQAGTLWPISSNAYLKQIAGSMPYATPFVVEVAPDAKSLLYSTYLDYAYVVTGISVLSNHNVFVTGNYPGPNYPATANAYQQNSGTSGAFLTELSSDGSSLVYSTTIGDSTYHINGLALDPDGDIWLAAQTSNSQFPLVNPIQATFPATGGFPGSASVLNQFDPTGQTLKFSTFLGGSAPGSASSVAVDANHKVHVSGAAQYGMYTTPGVYAGSVPAPGPGFTEATYAYVALIDPAPSSGTLCLGASASAGLSFGYLLPQTTASQNVQVTNCGAAPLTFSSIASNNAAFTVPAASNNCAGSLAVGSSCMVSVEFTPTAVQAYSGQLTFTSNASIATTSIQLSGNGGEPVAGFGNQTLIFSSVLVGQTSPVEYIGLYNNGTVPLTIYLSQIAVTSGFALAPGGNCPSSLPASQSCLIAVVFSPTTAGTFNGTLSVSSNDPVNPTISTSLTGTAFASYPVATITTLMNPSYPINSGTSPITMSVSGTNFFPLSVVYINGAAQTTTYQSDTFLTVTFDPSLVNTVGAIPVTVVNPTPGGGTSASYPLIGYRSLPLTSSALTVDRVGGLLYAAIPANASQNPNTIIPINPATGAMMTPIAVATGPRALAVSDDGSELFVASTGVLQRINLKTLVIEKTFNLPVDSEWGQTYVQEMHVVPGSPTSIVVELFANVDPSEDGAALYNDSGLVNWIPGQSVVNGSNSIFWLDSFTFTSSPSIIYGLPTENTFFTELEVSSTGLSRNENSPPGQISQQTGSIVRSDGTLLYTNSGQVWDPSTQKLLGTYLESNGSQFFYASGVVPETANGHTYFLDGDAQYAQSQAVNIDAYDQASYALLGTVPFTSLYPPDVTDLVRWGSNGFAFRCVDITGSDPSANQIVIVTSDLVTAGTTPVPILASVSPATVYAGGPAYAMQLTGSGFTSASTVLINGSPRTTTYVGGTSLTAQVLASDIASVGQLNIQVITPAPGGGTSNYVTVSIEAPLQTTPTVTVAPSTESITTAQTLTIAIAVTGGSGKATPTGSVMLTGGGYTSAAAALSSGAATITIPAGSLITGTDTLTANYTPDSGSSSIYKGATGLATVAVTAPPKTTPTVTATPSTSSITTAQSLTVSVTVSGGSANPKPTGAVALSGGGYTSAAVALSSGAATITIPAGSLTTGTDTLTANYTPDSASSSIYNGATGLATVAVTAPPKTTPTVTATPSTSSITTAQSLTLSVTVSGGTANPKPTGAVVLSGGGYTSAAVALSSGAATITIPAGSLATGSDTLTVAYTPDRSSSATYNSATGSTSVTVTAQLKSVSTVTVIPAALTITNEQTDAISITVAGVSGQATPTGTVTLASGTYSTEQTLSGGAASITIPAGALSSGADTLTAKYSGDGMYAGSSATASVTVAQVVISASTPSAVSPGGTTMTSVTFSAGSNYSGTMNVSCTLSSSPTGAQNLPTCALSPTSVVITVGGNGTTVMKVQTTAGSNTALLAPTHMKFLGLGGSGTILAGLLLLGVPARRRRWMAMMVLLWFIVGAGVIGCAGGGGSNSGSGGSSIPATTAGTYTFTVTGTDLANSIITTSTSVAVTVQ